MTIRKNTSLSRMCGFAVAGLMLVTSLCAFAGTAYAAPNGPQLSGPIAQVTSTPPPPEDDRRTISGDQIVSGNNFTLHANEILHGDLTVFGGSAVLEEGSQVVGNVSILGGSADVYGVVSGDINVVGGTLRLRSSAMIGGGLHMLGGNVDRDPMAQVQGQTSHISPPATNRIALGVAQPFNTMFDLIAAAFAKLAGLLFITIVALAVVTLFPSHTALTVGIVKQQWLVSGSIGVLTFIAMPVVLVLLAITICLIPVAIIAALAWTVAILFGWVITARTIGEWLARELHVTTWSMLGQTVMGVVILALLGMIPVIGWIIGFLASSVGMGALVLTRGGTRDYPYTPPIPPAPPSLPIPAPTE